MIRADNLKLLKKTEGLTDKDIALACGYAETSAGRIGKLISGKAEFSEKMREKLEDALRLPHKWLDEIHDGAEYSEESMEEIRAIRAAQVALRQAKGADANPHGQGVIHSDEAQDLSQVNFAETDTTTRLAPLIAWGKLKVELSVSNEVVRASTRLPVPGEASEKCKWVQVETDHPRLRIMRGDIIALDPVKEDTACIKGKVYLFQDAEGDMFLAEYRPLAGDPKERNFEAIPDAGAPLDKGRHGLKVIAKKVGSWEG